MPISATVRFLPLGRGGVEPYVGAGIGIFNWRYSEVGEFVDFSDDSLFRDRFIGNGTAVGPVVLGGIRFPVADVWTIGGEIRYQKAVGKDLLEKVFWRTKSISAAGRPASRSICDSERSPLGRGRARRSSTQRLPRTGAAW